MEDATHALLQDFVDSLANLPSEVSHLLTEVAFLDYAKSVPQQQQQLHSLLSSSQTSTQPNEVPPPVPQHGNGENGDLKRWYSVEEARRKAATKHSSIVRHAHRPPNNLMTPNPKETQLVERADAHYDDAVKLSCEKERLVARAHMLVCRHLDRLNSELAKLEQSTGVEIPDFKRDNIEVPAYLATSVTATSAGISSGAGGVGFDFAQLSGAAGIGAMGAAGAIGTPGPTFKGRKTIPTPLGAFQAPHLASLPPSHHPHAASHLASTPTNPYSSLHSSHHSAGPVSASLASLPGSQISVAGGPPVASPLGNPSLHASLGPPTGPPHHPSHLHGPRHRSRLHESATFHPGPHKTPPAGRKRNRRMAEDDDEEEDAEGEEDEEMEMEDPDAEGSLMDASMGDEKDEELYCFCQRQSFGEMIGCDNPTCQYEWFHLSCVGLKATPANTKWFCPSCRDEKKRSGQPARQRRR